MTAAINHNSVAPIDPAWHQYGARVIEQEWTGSFSEARNTSFEAATSDWIVYLDADEVLVEEDVRRLRALTGRVWREAFYLVETSYTGELGDGAAITNSALRVFRNRPHYRFEGRLHEQIAHHHGLVTHWLEGKPTAEREARLQLDAVERDLEISARQADAIDPARSRRAGLSKRLADAHLPVVGSKGEARRSGQKRRSH